MQSDLSRSILLIAEAASRPREPPPDALVRSSAAGMLLEPRMSSTSQELYLSLGEAVTASRMPPLPTVSEQLLSCPCERLSPPQPMTPTVGCDSASWKPGVAFRDEGCCCDSSGEDDLADVTYHFRPEEQEGNTSTFRKSIFPPVLEKIVPTGWI